MFEGLEESDEPTPEEKFLEDMPKLDPEAQLRQFDATLKTVPLYTDQLDFCTEILMNAPPSHLEIKVLENVRTLARTYEHDHTFRARCALNMITYGAPADMPTGYRAYLELRQHPIDKALRFELADAIIMRDSLRHNNKIEIVERDYLDMLMNCDKHIFFTSMTNLFDVGVKKRQPRFYQEAAITVQKRLTQMALERQQNKEEESIQDQHHKTELLQHITSYAGCKPALAAVWMPYIAQQAINGLTDKNEYSWQHDLRNSDHYDNANTPLRTAFDVHKTQIGTSRDCEGLGLSLVAQDTYNQCRTHRGFDMN